MVRNVPRKTAMYMLFTGFSISGKEAYEAGLVSKVVPNDKLGKLLKGIKYKNIYTNYIEIRRLAILLFYI